MADTAPIATNPSDYQTAVFGAGCFWCVEAVFANVPGVKDVVSGYAGGTTKNPTYDQVCSGSTGHAEVTKITYDPGEVSFADLVSLFWKIHDPTDPSGVWPDFGPMYRSIILGTNDAQLAEAFRLKTDAQKNYKKPIATEIALLGDFYPAEQYHQDFVDKNPDHPYVQRIAIPKMQKAKEALSQSDTRD